MLYRCSHCRRMLAATQFTPSAIAKRDYRCLACHRAKNKKLRDRDPARTAKATRERMRRFRAANPGRQETPRDPVSHRQRASKYAKANPEKKRAHNTVQRAVKDGRLQRKPCEVCGATRVQAHHDDYSKPLQVRWLCARHHTREHKWLN